MQAIKCSNGLQKQFEVKLNFGITMNCQQYILKLSLFYKVQFI